jgi:hypothetical protein
MDPCLFIFLSFLFLPWLSTLLFHVTATFILANPMAIPMAAAQQQQQLCFLLSF